MNHKRLAFGFVFVAVTLLLFVFIRPTAIGAQVEDSRSESSIMAAAGTAFTYQGRLTFSGIPANGNYNFRFYLYADELGTTKCLGIYPSEGSIELSVVDGLFSSNIDFGVGKFNGEARWMQIEVNGTLLTPLQPLTPTPYAIYAEEVGEHSHLGETWEGVNNPLVISGTFATSPFNSPLILNNSAGHGVRVESAGSSGVYVAAAEGSGMSVGWARYHGLFVNNAGIGIRVYSAGDSGVEVDFSGGSGMHVYSAGYSGVYVSQAMYGVNIWHVLNDGVSISNADDDGDGIGDGVYANKNGTDAEWGIITHDKLYAGGGVNSIAITIVAQVDGTQSLSTGDMVTASGVAAPLPDNTKPLPLVSLVVEGTSAGVIGVVEARMERVQVPQHPNEELEGREPRFTMRSIEGPAQPGDYVAITVLGIAQVKVAPGTDTQPGQRLTASSVAGYARALQTVQVEGVTLEESGAVLGIVLDRVEGSGELYWVMVNPQ